jgi:hypothetical protein
VRLAKLRLISFTTSDDDYLSNETFGTFSYPGSVECDDSMRVLMKITKKTPEYMDNRYEDDKLIYNQLLS